MAHDSFDAEAHDWILVEEDSIPPPSLADKANQHNSTNLGDADTQHLGAPPNRELPRSALAASAYALSNALTAIMLGRNYAADAVLDGAGGDLLPPLSLPTPLSDEPPPLSDECSCPSEMPAALSEFVDDDAVDIDKWDPRSAWGKPLAVVAVLIASHAAVLLLGVVIGRRLADSATSVSSSASSQTPTCSLPRRFSSGATGMHSRLCLA